MSHEELLRLAAHYVFFGDGQAQGSRRRPDPKLPSEPTERGVLMELLRPYLPKDGT